MHSNKRQTALRWLMLATLILLPACAAPPASSPPPLVVSNAEPTPLPLAIRSIDPTPSQDYLSRLEAFSQRLELWRLKVQALLDGETARSAP